MGAKYAIVLVILVALAASWLFYNTVFPDYWTVWSGPNADQPSSFIVAGIAPTHISLAKIMQDANVTKGEARAAYMIADGNIKKAIELAKRFECDENGKNCKSLILSTRVAIVGHIT